MLWRPRAVPLLACALTVALGLAVDAAATGPVGDKTGDVVYAVLVVLLAWLVRPGAPVRALGAVALAWCVAVELLQLTGVPARLAAAVPVARLVLGSGFDALDLVAYVVGVLLGAAVVVALRELVLRRAPAWSSP